MVLVMKSTGWKNASESFFHDYTLLRFFARLLLTGGMAHLFLKPRPPRPPTPLIG